jgi:hypothetical protein
MPAPHTYARNLASRVLANPAGTPPASSPRLAEMARHACYPPPTVKKLRARDSTASPVGGRGPASVIRVAHVTGLPDTFPLLRES